MCNNAGLVADPERVAETRANGAITNKVYPESEDWKLLIRSPASCR